jgi:hypothetical protein
VKIASHGKGGARMFFEPIESEVVAASLADLLAALGPDGLAADDPVYRRLYPAGYRDDPQAVESFRDLTEETLRTERQDRAEQCAADLAGARPHRRRSTVTVDAEGGRRWMQVLNDLRLALGTRLGIEEDDDYIDVDPDDPQARSYAIYTFLTGMQDALVRAVME